MTSRSQDQTGNLKVLGSGRLHAPEGGPSVALLESFPNCFPQRPYVISFTFPEFTSLCPVTGQPDSGIITVEYIPDQRCVESKSFKLYMFAFRNHQSFMETITNTVLEDLRALMAPCWCRVKGLFAPRGGTRIHVFAEDFKELPEERERLVRAPHHSRAHWAKPAQLMPRVRAGAGGHSPKAAAPAKARATTLNSTGESPGSRNRPRLCSRAVPRAAMQAASP